MASDGLIEDEKGVCRFSSSLSSAVSEWFLILLLFLNGFFSYLVTKFARYCNLQIPCLFCSRLDHVLDSESPCFYDNLICKSHKLEISSLAYCHIEQKLADVREMCESCLHSFATEKKSNSDTYRSLVGKLEMNTIEEKLIPKSPENVEYDGLKAKLHGEDAAQVPLLKADNTLGFLRKKSCSCCNEPFRMKSYAQRLLQTKCVAADITEPDSPVFGLNALARTLRRDSFNKRKESVVAPSMVSQGGHSGSGQMSHIGYTELKITSDSESEIPASDDDDGNTLRRLANAKEECVSRSLQSNSLSDASNVPKPSEDDILRGKITDPATSHSLLDILEQHIHLTGQSAAPSLETDVIKSHGLEELNWNELKGAAHPTTEFSNSNMDVGEITCTLTPPTEVSKALDLPEICLRSVPSVEVSKQLDLPELCSISDPSTEVSKALDLPENCSRTNSVLNDLVVSIPGVLDLNDAYKLVIVSKGNEPPSKDSSQVHADLKLLLTQISRGLEFPWNEMSASPRLRGLVHQDSKASDASGISGPPTFTRRLSLERNESGLESSIDGSVFSEIEGEGPGEKLKRHAEFDKKSLSLLYKELEEERSASAIAANQAMAMITRLQEEKAAMQMEALQYLRMMEEQAEYDQEALQRSADLLAQRDKEIQALDGELASHRSQFNDMEDERTSTSLGNNVELRNGPINTGSAEQSVDYNNSPRTAKLLLDSNRKQNIALGDSLLKFEEEKAFIADCLKKLEKKLQLSPKHILRVDRAKEILNNETKATQILTKEDDVDGARSLQNDAENASSLSGKNSHSDAENGAECAVVDNHKSDINGLDQHSSPCGGESVAIDIVSEISLLSDRLESLEADKNLLEHMINSLQNGKEGLELVREVACHVRELRKGGTRRRDVENNGLVN